jgi:transposase InsO family protein/transposase-like protein
MDKGRYLVEAHLRDGRAVAELAAAHGVHPSWIYRLLARYHAEGDAGLIPRSRRPKTSPTALSHELEDEIVLLRKQLSEDGLDAGAQTLHWHLERRHGSAPSVSTIMRVLRRRGCVTPQPKKRPKSSFIRFEASLPNECWQSDMTHWRLADGTDVEIVNFVDDHSRLCVASVAFAVTKATDVVAVFGLARRHYGTPAAVLTDNGCIYTARYRGGKVAMETTLEQLGVTYKHPSPYHPQTCGKVERFHQTLKRYLTKQPARTLDELQHHINRFVTYYNQQRPHRALNRHTPQEVFDTKVKAHPDTNTQRHYRIRHDKVDGHGSLTIRYQSKLHHIGMGARHKHQPVTMLIADRDIRVINNDGELLRHLELDPTRDYQPQSWGWCLR